MRHANPYVWAGFGLLVAGGLISATAYFVLDLVWLAALGIAMLILSFICLVLGRTIPRLSPEASVLFLETGNENLAALIEELGIKTKAVYLPSSLAHGRPKALIPLHSDPALPAIPDTLPERLIVKYGPGADDVGLLVTTPGSTAVGMMESTLGSTLSDLETALTSLLSGVLGVADGTTVVSRDGILVEVRNPRLESRRTWTHATLGDPLASIVASVAAEVLGKPVVIRQDEKRGTRQFVTLAIVE